MSGKSRIKSSDIKVGDMIEVSTGDHIPADCILLASMYQIIYKAITNQFLSKLINSMVRLIGN